MTTNKNNDELRSVLLQLQADEDNAPESIKAIRQKDETLEIFRQQLREIKSIANNVRLLTAILIISIIVEFIWLLFGN